MVEGIALFLAVLCPKLAVGQRPPVRLSSLATKYDEFRRSVGSISCHGQLFSSFTVNRARCTGTHEFELRSMGGVTNVLTRQVGYTGYEPHYRYSDGVRHSGIDPERRSLFYSNGSVRANLDVTMDRPSEAKAAMLDEFSEESPDVLREGRTLPSLKKGSANAAFKTLKNGHLSATFILANGDPLTLEVAPEHDDMIVQRTVGELRHPKFVAQIEEFQRVDRLILPKAVRNTTFNVDGSVVAVRLFTYQDPVISNSPNLWMASLPATLPYVASQGRVYINDGKGNLALMERKRREAAPTQPTDLIRLVSLFGLIAFAGVLIYKRRKGAQIR